MKELLTGLAAVAVLFVIYFFPGIIAEQRKTGNRNGIILLNLVTGWTGIGWLICLVMACGSNRAALTEEGDVVLSQNPINDIDALERLVKMKRRGFLTEEEFQSQKSKILNA